MGAIPTQRETAPCVSGARERAWVDATLPGSPLAPGTARAVLRKALGEWAELAPPGAEHLTGRVGDDATLIASELVTNAVVHAGTEVRLTCRLEEETGAVVVEVADRHPSRTPRGHEPEETDTPEYGRGLRLVAALSESWGITYRPGTKTIWARLPAGGSPSDDQIEAYAEEGTLARDLRAARVLAPRPPAPRTPLGAGPSAPDSPGAEHGAPAGRTASGSGTAGPIGVERPAPGPLGEGPRTGDPLGSGAGAPGSLGPDRSAPAELATEAGAAGPYGVGQSDPAASGAGPGGADSAGGERSPLPASGTGGRASAALAAGAYVNGASGAGQAVPGALAAERSGVGALEVLDPLLSRQGAARDACRGGGSYGDDWLARRSGQDGAWLGRGALSFLAEASDLLAGQLDEDLVASLTGQLIVPRLADWCAVWLEDETTGHGGASGPRLARVWHAGEDHIEDLGAALRHNPPHPGDPADPGPAPYPWPEEALDAPADGHPAGGTPPHVTPGTALAYRLVAGGRPLGSLVIGRGGIERFPDEITGLVEDLTRRVALAIGAARQYSRQATISAVLQRGLLPGAVAEIPGVRTALVYEPCDKGGPSGDFYDLFPAGQGRWCFAVGDVQGKGPEAAVVIGLVRPWLRLLAREGYRVADVLDRLNQLLLDDATEAADAAARALVAAGARPTAPGDGPQTRFLSLLYGELVPFADGFRCTLASAGHPLPLLLAPDGSVRAVAQPQTLIGVVDDATYTSETFEMYSGDTLLCVTDGVTERRSGSRQFDDGDGLATALSGCAGMHAEPIADRITQLVHEFGARPPADDLALLVLQAE